jgi:ABC-type antimicrobial peptide transport system permease subunit
MLKGSAWWAPGYAITSLKNYPIRNMGIALVLAIGVALPTTVFVWAHTGTRLTVNEYFSETSYQMSFQLRAGELYDPASSQFMQTDAIANPFIEDVHQVTSTIGIYTNDSIPEWGAYVDTGLNYALGIKDARVIITDNAILGNWSREFTYEGKFSLTEGEILVSEGFVEYTRQVHSIELEIGMEFDLEILGHAPRYAGQQDRDDHFIIPAENLTIAGIYRINSLDTQLGQAFPSVGRKNWDPLSLFNEPVLGMHDSVIILEDEIGIELTEEITNWGYYGPSLLIRPSADGLMAAGAENIGDNLESFKTLFEESYTAYTVNGIQDIRELEANVNTYLSSQVLTLVAFPVLIMSLMLTVFTSETSISRRKGEISALRSKGASFNQVFSTFMWESLLLGVVGLGVGIFLSIIMAPLIGATVEFFIFDLGLFMTYLSNLTIPPLSLVIAAAISMYLPASYLLHVARRIDVTEVGQPITAEGPEGAETSGIWRYAIGLGVVLTSLLVMPLLVDPSGTFAVAEVLIATLFLFMASYLGSRTMRLVTARLSGETSFLLGEKSLYLSQSLRKRKGQFIPLLVILTLTLTTTTMMLIQTSSFEATIQNELRYSLGADMRIECDAKPVNFNDTLITYPGVLKATPVVETLAQVGGNAFFLEGVNPNDYLEVGAFTQESFITGTPESVLSDLANKTNGIIISSYYSQLWNKTINDEVLVYYDVGNGTRVGSFNVTGIMRSAPGFGVASRDAQVTASFAAQFGFQVGAGGFALVNLDFLYEIGGLTTSELFLVDTVSFTDITLMVEELQQERNQFVFTVDTFDLASQSTSIQLFLSGIQGLTVISFILCLLMGLSAIALFLGSAVLDRQAEYAVFRALGGSKSQVVMMVFGEFAGTVIASIGISLILGVVFGYSMSILTFGVSPFSPVLTEVLALPLTMMIVILSLESIVMLASCYLPARRAGAIDPASALRNL